MLYASHFLSALYKVQIYSQVLNALLFNAAFYNILIKKET